MAMGERVNMVGEMLDSVARADTDGRVSSLQRSGGPLPSVMIS